MKMTLMDDIILVDVALQDVIVHVPVTLTRCFRHENVKFTSFKREFTSFSFQRNSSITKARTLFSLNGICIGSNKHCPGILEE